MTTPVDDAIPKLSDFSKEKRVEVSMALLKSPRPEVRAAVAYSVARLEIRAVGAWYELANALADDYESVRRASAEAFWQLNGVDYAIRSLRDEHGNPAHMTKQQALEGIRTLLKATDDKSVFIALLKDNWQDCPLLAELEKEVASSAPEKEEERALENKQVKISKEKAAKTNVEQDLLNLKSKISELPKKYPIKEVSSFGAGLSQAQEQIPIICLNIDQAVKALKTGFDPHNNPITKPLIAQGLKKLLAATRAPGFIGLVGTVINADGIKMLEKHLDELSNITSRI
jgi:hypothetical protein